MILTIPLSPFNHIDSWFWHYTTNGKYSVKSGYQLALNLENKGPSSSSNEISLWWKTFWAVNIPRKILLFGWRGYHETLPTTKGLYRRNVTQNSNCPLCGYGEDSNAHAVFWCIFSQEVWKLMEYSFLVGHKEEISFKGVILYATELLNKEEFAKMLIVAWGIWCERNKKNHGQQQRTPQQIKSWLSSYFEEINDACITKDNERSQIPNVNQMVVDNNAFTLCVDAALSSISQKIGIGAVLYTPSRRVQARLSKPLEGSLSAIHAEALAVIVGLQWVQYIGLPIKVILSDSLTLVQALNNNTPYNNELGILLTDIKMLLTNCPEAMVSHVSRKFNFAAHGLAKHALQLDEEAI